VDGERGCQIKFAKCCNPLPGDKIIGFITRGFGVSLHKSDCLNVINGQKDPESQSRWVSAEWERDNAADFGMVYEAALQLELEDGIGVIATISMALAEMKVSIMQINTQKSKNGDLMIVNLTIGCKNTSHYDSIVSKLRQLPCVVSVTRGFTY
jgi:GTP pyrophosphokinase